MPNTNAELQELAELEELAALEGEAASAGRAPALEQEQGLSGGGFSPTKLIPMAIDMLGGSSNAVGSEAVNMASMGYMPEIAGGVRSLGGEDYVGARDAVAKDMAIDSQRNPNSALLGKGLGLAGGAGATAAMAPAAAPGVAGRISQAAAMGGAQGLAANPGRTAGELAPAQPVERLQGGALGAFLGGTFGGVGELIKKGAQTAKDVSLIKQGGASDLAKQEIDSALQAIDEKQLAPRDAKLRELIQGQQFNVNPDMVEGTFPNLAKTMQSKLVGPGETRRALSPERALRLKRAADAAANYGQSKAFDPSAVAKGEEAKSLADILRSQINRVPGAQDINAEMADIMAKKNALARGARNAPISSIRAQPGTDKDSLVKAVDKLAGSDLEGLDSRIGNAKDLLLHPGNFAKPLEALNELKRVGIRGGAEASRVLDKAPVGTKESLINALLQGKRKDH